MKEWTVDEIEKSLNKLSKAFKENYYTLDEFASEYTKMLQREDMVDHTRCLIDEYFKDQPKESRSQPILINCPCKKCTPYSL